MIILFKNVVLSCLLILMAGWGNVVWGQTQEIFWRAEAGSGNWFEGTNPCAEIGTADSQWFYPHYGANTSRNAPNCFGIYDLVFDNNHETSMNNSEAFFDLNRITFTANATSGRTISGEGIDVVETDDNTPIIRNNSTATHTFTNNIALQSSPVELNPVSGNLQFNGQIFTNGNFIDVFGDNGNTLSLNGVVEGSGGISLKQNSTIQIGAAMTYTGSTAVEAGTFQLVSGGDLSNSTDVTISSGATFDLNDQPVTVRSVGETGTSNGGSIDLGNEILTIAGGYTTDRFQNTISGTGGLIKNGSGLLGMYGANTYTGETIINGGSIQLNNESGLGTIDAGTTVNDGASLILNAGTDYPAEALTITGIGVSGNGAMQKIGSGTNEFPGPIALAGDTRINVTGGTLDYRDDINLNGNTLYLGGNQNHFMGFGSSLSGGTKTVDNGAIFKDGSGYFELRPAGVTGSINLEGGEIRIVDTIPSGGLLRMAGGTLLSSNSTTDRVTEKDMLIQGDITLGGTVSSRNGSLTISGNVDMDGGIHTLTTPVNNSISGIISNGGINKDGSGTLTLSAENTYEDDTIVSAGTLQLTGTLASLTDVRVASGATFDVDNNISIASLAEVGSSNGGTVDIASGQSLTITGANKGVLFQNSISGGGSLIVNASGDTDLSLYGTQNYTGATTISGGTLSTSVGLSSSAIDVQEGGTFTVVSGSTVTLADITVRSGGVLRVESGADVTHNSITVEPGGILINDGTINGAVTFEREIADSGNWVAFSSPVSGGAFAGPGGLFEQAWTQGFDGSDDPSAGDPNVVFYDETSTASTNNERYTAPSSNSMEAGKGYFMLMYQRKNLNDPASALGFPFTFSVDGTENVIGSSFDFSPTYTAAGGEGWNLMGNPFGASLDWGSGSWTKTNLNGFAYIWNPETELYKVTSGGDTSPADIEGITTSDAIAPFQAFWVKANASAPALSVAPGARSENIDNSTLFKEKEISKPVIALELTAGEISAATAFRFSEEYETEFTDHDAYYLTPLTDSFVYFYSVNSTNPTLLKSLPENSDKTIEIPIEAGAYVEGSPYSGHATLRVSSFEVIPEEWSVELIDRFENRTINLKESEEYSFLLSSTAQKDRTDKNHFMTEKIPVFKQDVAEERFVIRIQQSASQENLFEYEIPAQLTLRQNYPNPFNPTTVISYDLPENSQVNLAVYDMMGRRVATLVNENVAAGTHQVPFDAGSLSSGTYMYRLQAGGNIQTKKLTLIK